MWVDRFKLNILGQEIEGARAIESPAAPDELELTFSDGSRLGIRVEVDCPEAIARLRSEGAAAEFAQSTAEVPP